MALSSREVAKKRAASKVPELCGDRTQRNKVLARGYRLERTHSHTLPGCLSLMRWFWKKRTNYSESPRRATGPAMFRTICFVLTSKT